MKNVQASVWKSPCLVAVLVFLNTTGSAQDQLGYPARPETAQTIGHSRQMPLNEVRITPEGTMEFETSTEGINATYLRILPRQRTHGNTSFAIRATSHLNAGSSRNNDVAFLGFGVNEGGGAIRTGEAGIAIGFENHYEPVANLDFKEFHILHVDKSGIQQRPMSIVLDNDNPGDWYGYHRLNRFFWADPTNNFIFAEMFRDGISGANFRLLGSESGNGATIYVNAVSNTLQLLNTGMTNPDFYATAFSNTHVQHLRITHSKGTAPIFVAGRDAQGYITNVPLGANLSISDDGMLVAQTKADTVSLQWAIQDWNKEVLAGHEQRMNIPMQYDGYRIVEIWCWSSDPGDQGNTEIAIRDVTSDKALATVALQSQARSSVASGFSQSVQGGNEISFAVTAHSGIPAKGMRVNLVLTK